MAGPLLQRAEAIDLRAAPDSPRMADIEHDLARIALRRNHLDAAEPLLARAIALIERRLGGDSPHLAPMLVDLAAVRAARGDSKSAEALLRRALANDVGALGGESAPAAEDGSRWAGCSQVPSRFGEAVPLQAAGVAALAERYGEDSPSGAADVGELAVSVAGAGRLEGVALQLLRPACAVLSRYTALRGHRGATREQAAAPAVACNTVLAEFLWRRVQSRSSAGLLNEGFLAVQQARWSATADSLARATAGAVAANAELRRGGELRGRTGRDRPARPRIAAAEGRELAAAAGAEVAQYQAARIEAGHRLDIAAAALRAASRVLDHLRPTRWRYPTLPPRGSTTCSTPARR
jgi:hypothetical protein